MEILKPATTVKHQERKMAPVSIRANILEATNSENFLILSVEPK